MTQTKSNPPRRSWWRRAFRGLFFSGAASLGLFVILNVAGLVTVGDAVELFRRVTGEPGTRLVRWMEEIYFETTYEIAVWWNNDENRANGEAQAALPLVVSQAGAALTVRAEPAYDLMTPKAKAEAKPLDRVPPTQDIPWTPYLHADGSPSGIYTAQIFPNHKLPKEPVYLAWIDQSKLQPNWIPGTTEPEGDPALKIDRSGRVPEKDKPKLVAAFNGGYLSKHGHFGAKFNGVVVIPPRDGLASGAITKDGTFLLGAYGRDIDPKDKNVVTVRQNLRLVVDGGAVPDDIKRRSYGAVRLGLSEDDPLAGDLKAHTWRSGLGITKEGDLIFAAGDYLDGEMLASSLQLAGSERAMQLDVNAPYFCVFLFFEPSEDGTLVPLVLGPKMTPRPGQFISARSNKDFVYLTRK